MKIPTATIVFFLSTWLVYGQGPFYPGLSPDRTKTRIDYSTGDDQTTVTSPFTVLYLSSGSLTSHGEMLAVGASFRFQGMALKSRPEEFNFQIFSDGENTWKFKKEKSRHLRISVDDHEVTNGTMERVKAVQNHTINASFTRYYETLSFPIRFDDFVRICSATKVSILLGKSEKYWLSKRELEGFRHICKLADVK